MDDAPAPTDALAIRREIDLDADLDELWALVSSPAGWQSWMVDRADFPTSGPDQRQLGESRPIDRQLDDRQLDDAQLGAGVFETVDEFGAGETLLRPGATGVVIDDGRRRRVLVEEIVESSRVTFTWWGEDEGDAPSRVTITIGSGVDGRRRLQVVERPIRVVPQASLTLPDGLRWDVRLTCAAICLSAFSVRV